MSTLQLAPNEIVRNKNIPPYLKIILFSYVDTSVLLENMPLVKFVKNYIRDPSGLFSIIPLVSIPVSLSIGRNFGNFPPLLYPCLFVYIMKKKNITRRLEDMNFMFSWQNVQYFTHSLHTLVRKILLCHSKIKFISSRHRVISSMSIVRYVLPWVQRKLFMQGFWLRSNPEALCCTRTQY